MSRFFQSRSSLFTNLSFFVAGATISAYQYRKNQKKNPLNTFNSEQNVTIFTTSKKRIKSLLHKYLRIGSAPSENPAYDKPHKKFHDYVADEFGLPSFKEIRAYHEGYISSCDAEKKIPNWVIESFDKAYVSTPEDKKVKRTQEMFTSDGIVYIDNCFRAKNEDYYKV